MNKRYYLFVVAVLVVVAITNHFQGRLWLCESLDFQPWVSEPDGPHTSQHLADPYTFSHMQHGLFLWFVLASLGTSARKYAVVGLEGLWEIIENTSWIINRYREGTASLGYTGDTILNSTGDIIACIIGMEVARKVGLVWTIAIFFIIEAVMLWLIRDNLTLNVIMLVYPLDFIKEWQLK